MQEIETKTVSESVSDDLAFEWTPKTRFSKLQKWILMEVYKTINPQRDKPRGGLSRRIIVWDYFGLNNPGVGYTTPTNSQEVSITRAIWNLYEAGYIIAYSVGKDGEYYHPATERDLRDLVDKLGGGVLGRNIKYICLTDKGVEKARQLLNVK